MHRPSPDDRRAAHRAPWHEHRPAPAADGHRTSGPRNGTLRASDALRHGGDTLRAFETAEVGDVAGRTLLHLQCRTGLDTLSWALRGAAQVVGLDHCEAAVDTARDLAADLGLAPDRAAFVAADVYDAAEAVPDSSYDVVYTGAGALCRLPDVRRWAEIAASLVAPGGFLYLAEPHPFAAALDDGTGSRVVHDYFNRNPWVDGTAGADGADLTYADFEAATVPHRRVEWQHPVGEVVSAIAAAGLRIDFLHEHEVTPFRRFACLERRGDHFRLPADRPRVPLTYSIRATRA